MNFQQLVDKYHDVILKAETANCSSIKSEFYREAQFLHTVILKYLATKGSVKG